MDESAVWIYLAAYLIPMMFFFYMGIDVMIRDSKKVEHRLLALITFCYIMLFMEEYIRHQLPISYSAELAAFWFSNAGIMIPGLGFHFIVKFSGMDKRMPRYVYPYIFYTPVILVVLNVIGSDKVISAHQFVQAGVWKIPVYNMQYYIAMAASILNNLLYVIPLMYGRKRAVTAEHRAIYDRLMYGVLIVALWHVLFGFIKFGDSLPPYPYLYGGLVWCFFLRHTMRKYDFLNFTDKRYEMLFNLNPAAILLVDTSGKIKEANPGARQLLHTVRLDDIKLYALLNNEVRSRLEQRAPIRSLEATVFIGGKQLDLLIDGDYISVDYEPHAILIFRDVTSQNDIQKEIRFLAFHDALTRLPNRRYFYEKLGEAIQDATQRGGKLAVILIDLDGFKQINDRYGHQAGDEALQHAAAIISEYAGAGEIAARLGGDEFALFLRHDPSPEYVRETVRQLAHTFRQSKFTYQREAVSVGMSAGASLFPDDGRDLDALLNRADKAMYEMKRAGRSEEVS